MTTAVLLPSEQRSRAPLINSTALLAILSVVSIFIPANPVAQATLIVGSLAVLGSILGRRLLEVDSVPLRVSICAGVGFLTAIVVGALTGYVLAVLGISRPLSSAPIVVVWSMLLGGMALWSLTTRNDPLRDCVSGMTRRDAVWIALLGIPPLFALVGVAKLNSSASPAISIVVGLFALILVGAAIALPRLDGGPPKVLLLASALLTVGWQTPMRGGWLTGGDIQHEYYVASLAVQQGRFPLHHYTDPYAGMLSLTVWPAMVHRLTGLSLRNVLALLPSLFLVVCLLAIWGALRERIGPRGAAALCAVFVLGSSSLMQEYPGVTRECYAIFFFALLVLAVTSTKLPTRHARALVVVAGLGMALTHYTTAYLAAGAVLTAWLLSLVLRPSRGKRVLATAVVAINVAAAAIWGSFVARTGSNIREVAHAISADGLQLLPGKGGFLSRWLHGSVAGVAVTAKALRVNDVALLFRQYTWMRIAPNAVGIRLLNDPSPTARGVGVLGPGLSGISTIVAELVVVGAFVSVVYCVWRARRDRQLVGIAGMGIFSLVISALSRDSATVAAYFGPERLQVQAYVVFAMTVAIMIASFAREGRFRLTLSILRGRSIILWSCVAIVGMIVVSYSTGLGDLVTAGRPLDVAYSAIGEQIEFQPTPADLLAGGWLAVHRRTGLVQSDYAGKSTLYAFGYAHRSKYVTSLDPVITDTRSWLFAFHSDVVLGRAFGGTTTYVGAFRFPGRYLSATRPILYVSPSDVIYGSAP